MTIFLFSDDVYEQNAIACIKSLETKLTDDVRIVYYTVGFETKFQFKNLITHKYPINPFHKKFNFYKPELCLYTIEHYNDDCYVFMDIDFIFSKNFDLNLLKHDEQYPLASYGPVEFPCIWEGETVYTETALMEYFGMKGGYNDRTMRYVWSCIFSFNDGCIDFIEEWESLCTNKYLLKNQPKYFPYQDEPAFNVCLWKRGATKNLGFGFLNTIDVKKFIFTEESRLLNFCFGESLDVNDYDWECVDNSDSIVGYHAFKLISDIDACTEYLQTNKNVLKQIFIIDCYADNNEKFDVLRKNIQSINPLQIDILLVTHCIIPEDIISMVKYYVYDADNTFNEINFNTFYNVSGVNFDLQTKTTPDMGIKSHEFPIVKSIRNALSFAKSAGYESFMFSEYDNIFTKNDLSKIQKLYFNIFKYNKAFIMLKQNEDAVETIFFSGIVNDMLDMVNKYFPKTVEQYNLDFTYRWPYSLEIFFKEMALTNIQSGQIIDKTFTQFFEAEEKNIFRVGAVSTGILPDTNTNKYYLYVSNKDNVEYTILIKENDIVINTFNIINNTIPVFEVTQNSKFNVEFLTQDGQLYKTFDVDYDTTKNEMYNKCGNVNFK